MPDSSIPITTGAGANVDTITAPSGDHRQVVFVGNRGGVEVRANTFRIAGRNSGTRQVLLTVFNATGSTVDIEVKSVIADIYSTAAKAITVHRPILRLYRITAASTGGTAATKVVLDTGAGTSNASVTATGDASADGTNSASALAATITAGNIITQELTPQMITGAGYEMADRIEFIQQSPVVCKAGQGIALAIDYPAIASNPTTDMWVCGAYWEEYTP